MPIDYLRARALKTQGQPFAYTAKDAMLYALGIGFGRDPMDENELRFVYERALSIVPTMATVIAWGAGALESTGIDFTKVVQGEQRLTLFRPLPISAELIADWAVDEVIDKGPGRGALVIHHFDLRLSSGEKLATVGRTTFARGDGGFGGPAQGGPLAHLVPDRRPDGEMTIATPENLALLYRLSGDRNPLHADPEVAQAAGFARPILHGLCTYGIACRAILATCCDFDPARLRQFDVRFSAPAYPGDTLLFRIWRDGETVSFTASVPARNALILNNGRAVIGA